MSQTAFTGSYNVIQGEECQTIDKMCGIFFHATGNRNRKRGRKYHKCV
jgi:hypothetical protein